MTPQPETDTAGYAPAMGRLLVLYTQVDKLIMEVCAERLETAPDEAAELALAKQVGDESRHVSIQRDWMVEFGTDPTPVISPLKERTIREHFRSLSWIDFLADLYIGVEALGGAAVHKVVPLADPGTRESLRIPLRDEIDHVAFGIGRLKEEVARLSEAEREAFFRRIPDRIDALIEAFEDGLGFALRGMFEAVGVDYDGLRETLHGRRAELLADIMSALPGAPGFGERSAAATVHAA